MRDEEVGDREVGDGVVGEGEGEVGAGEVRKGVRFRIWKYVYTKQLNYYQG